jgi:hypothetical protein
MKKRMEKIDQELQTADPLHRLHLVQERLDLQNALEASSATVDLGALEDEFVAAARDYSERKGISYAAWREMGVSAAVLKRAGIGRGASAA